MPPDSAHPLPSSRRTFATLLLGLAVCLARSKAQASPAPKRAPSKILDQLDLELPGDRTVARKARVLYARSAAPNAAPGLNGQTPILVLLHGLGETRSEQLALKAWSDLYGLRSAVKRLWEPPVTRTLGPSIYLTDARLERINRALRHSPYEPPVLVCPVTPRPASHASREQLFQRYADWIEAELLPAVRQRVPHAAGPVGLAGCSMGGYVATEVLLRKPRLFSSFGTVQSAIGEWRAPGFATRLAAIQKTGQPRIHLQTSTEDPFRAATESLSRELAGHGVPHELDVIPGPHDQPWLREVGTLEMLRWHTSALRRPGAQDPP